MSAGRRRAAGTRALAALLAALSAPWSNACARTTPFSKDWANTVAICAIMRKEKTEDVREWLQYHRCALVLCKLTVTASLETAHTRTKGNPAACEVQLRGLSSP